MWRQVDLLILRVDRQQIHRLRLIEIVVDRPVPAALAFPFTAETDLAKTACSWDHVAGGGVEGEIQRYVSPLILGEPCPLRRGIKWIHLGDRQAENIPQ